MSHEESGEDKVRWWPSLQDDDIRGFSAEEEHDLICVLKIVLTVKRRNGNKKTAKKPTIIV